MQYYYGQPYGNEVEGRSKVVTTEVKDAVEGILPSLMAIFTGSDQIVRFDARKESDEDDAAQATDYAHYVFGKSGGFLALYCLFKDALLQKNGYTKIYWNSYKQQSKESYEGLDDNQFHSLMQDEDLELLEHTESPDELAMEERAKQLQQMQQQLAQAVQQLQKMPPQQAQQSAPQLQAAAGQIEMLENQPAPKLHDAVFRRARTNKGICLDPTPPEEILVSRETPNELKKARFVEHRTLRTLSEIREMGYDVEDGIADYAPNADFNLERVERLKYDDALAYRVDSDTADPSTKRVWLCEAYLRVDYDGDGIAELRKVTKVGKTILDNEGFDSLPIIGGTAILMPHKHYGLSIFDLVGDIQLIKSTITRQLLDNAYGANNSRVAVLDGMVNMQDLLTSRPNGIVRVKALGAVTQLPNQLLGQPFYNLLDYFDKVKQNRVGATDFPNAVDPDAINAKATFVDAFKNAAMERVNLMARILAETCVKDFFWKIIELSAKHQDKKQMVKLRGKWVEVDPRNWIDKFDMSITVGLGTGNQAMTLQGAMGIVQAQFEAMKMGFADRVVTEENVYESLKKFAKATFPKDAESFFTDPRSLGPKQPQPNPDMLKIQLAAHKTELQDAQKKAALEQNERLATQEKQFQAYMAKQDAAEEQRKQRAAAEQQERDRIADLAKTTHEEMVANREMDKKDTQILLQGVLDAHLSKLEHHHAKVESILQGHVDTKVAKAKPKPKPAGDTA